MQHSHKRILVLVLALLALCITPALVAQESLVESVCLVTDVGKVDDGTFNQFAYEGMIAVAEDYGLETNVIETTQPTEYTGNIQRCIDSDADAVVTVGFLLQDDTLAFANDNPDVYFIGVDQGYEAPPENLVGVQFREDQAGFLAGAMAALMSESGTVGGVYGIDVPAVKKFRNGFEQGARYINPDINTLGVYVPSFVDSATGGLTAETMIGEGADVIFGAGGQTGSGGIQAAAAQGVYVIGVDQDEYVTTFGNGSTPGAEYLITSAVKRVDQGVYQPIEALVNGDLENFGGGGIKVLSANNEGIGFAPAHDAEVPQEVTDQVTEILEGLQAGTIVTGVDPITGDMLPTIAEILASNEELSSLAEAVEAAGLSETLSSDGPVTLFAPNNAAFEASEGLPEDAEALSSLLQAHVVENAVLSGDVSELDGANVVTADILARNGVIHIIDAVLAPQE